MSHDIDLTLLTYPQMQEIAYMAGDLFEAAAAELHRIGEWSSDGPDIGVQLYEFSQKQGQRVRRILDTAEMFRPGALAEAIAAAAPKAKKRRPAKKPKATPHPEPKSDAAPAAAE